MLAGASKRPIPLALAPGADAATASADSRQAKTNGRIFVIAL
jgi:hypothetical protein